MNDDELERLLADSFDRQARASVGRGTPVPPPRFANVPPAALVAPQHRGGEPRRHRRWLAPVAAAAAVVAVAGTIFGLTRSDGPAHTPAAAGRHTSSSASVAARPPAATRITKPVSIKVATDDGAMYGVGMPVVVLISHRISDGKAFQQATHVAIDGRPVTAAWYFERSTKRKGYPLEAHLRMRNYWPGHARVVVSLPVRGVSAGDGYRFAANTQVSFLTGPQMISTVDDRTHVMTVRRDGEVADRFPVSLGAKKTPTSNGIKVVMAKGTPLCMSGPGYQECGIKYTQQLTYGGEYLHSAPWNVYHIEKGIDTSNGCTNLLPQDARMLYQQSEVGDVVDFVHAKGPKMTMSAGLGDWNVPWSTWLRGGAVPTH